MDTKPSTRNFPATPDWRALLAIIVGTVLYVVPLSRMGFLGMDWLVYFTVEQFGSIVQRPNPVYPPWVIPVMLRPLTTLPPYVGLAILNAITLSTLTVLTFRYARHAHPENRLPALTGVLLAILNPLPWMVFWLGQVDMLTLLGLVAMPFGMPLLLAKLNIGAWAVLGSRRDMLWAVGWGILSLLIWGLWPLTSLQYSVPADASNPHPSLMGWQTMTPLILVVGLLLLLLSNRDPLRLIAAGMFISPYVMPYHFLVLLPALGRLTPFKQIVLWPLTIVLVFATAVDDKTIKLMAYGFPLLIWALTAPSLKPRALMADPESVINRLFKTLHEAQQWISSRRVPLTASNR